MELVSIGQMDLPGIEDVCIEALGDGGVADPVPLEANGQRPVVGAKRGAQAVDGWKIERSPGVELDGTRFGHPIGFLEEAFGGLVRTDKATDAELDLQGDSETAATIRRLMAEARKNTR